MRKTLRNNRLAAIALLVLCVVTACRRVPGHIISPDDMAGILADMHVGEAVEEVNRREFYNDSVKMLLKQSILMRHGVDGEKFDSSLSWYAHHPQLYLEVYDQTIELLQDRMSQNDAQLAQTSLSAVGDSVDLWAGSRYLSVGPLSASRTITFRIEADENSQPGDRYTWRGKFIHNMPPVKWGIAATYTDGTFEWYNGETGTDGWSEIEFVSDSTLVTESVYGYMTFTPQGNVRQWVDSLQLIRNRCNPANYMRHYRQKSYRP